MNEGADNINEKMSVSEKIGAVLFFLSFAPLIYAIVRSFTGVLFGFRSFAWFFGFGAIIITLVNSGPLFFLLPVACLIYQIAFGRKVIRYYGKLKKASLFFIAFIVLAVISSSILAETSLDLKIRMTQPKINPHLTTIYGETAVSHISYQIDSRYAIRYMAYSPVLPENEHFEIQITPGNEVYDDLAIRFIDINKDFYKNLTEYVKAKENIPADTDVTFSIVSIDFGDYHDGDDYKVLFERTRYMITRISTKSR